MKSSPNLAPAAVALAAVGAGALVSGALIHDANTPYYPVQDFCADGNNFPVEPGVELDDGSNGWVDIVGSSELQSKLKVVPHGTESVNGPGVFIKGTHPQICALLDDVETYSHLRDRALAFMDELAGPDERGRGEPMIIVKSSFSEPTCFGVAGVTLNPLPLGYGVRAGADLEWGYIGNSDFSDRGLFVDFFWDRDTDKFLTSSPLGSNPDLALPSFDQPPVPSEWLARPVCPSPSRSKRR